MGAKRIDAPGWVYKIVDVAGRCLYVGQTRTHPESRLYQHRLSQPWAKEIARIVVLAEGATEAERRTLENQWANKLEPKYGTYTRTTPRPNPRAKFPPSKLLYSVADVAHMLSIGRSMAYRLVQDGTLPTVSIGARKLVAAEGLHAYVASLEVAA